MKKNITILKFKVRLYHGNLNSYMFNVQLYTSLSDAIKKDLEANNIEGNILTKT